MGMAEWLELHHNIKPYICSRLDKGTSGILLFALTPEASAQAEKIHNKELALKSYYFISHRQHSGEKEWKCSEPLDGKACITAFKEIKGGNGYFLYKAEIKRGRKHQIRRHAAFSGVPLLGDDEYGGNPFSRLCLHCGDISWPGLKKTLSVDLPDSFQLLIEGKKGVLLDVAIAHERRLNLLPSISEAYRIIHRGEIKKYDISVDIFGEWLSITGYDEEFSTKHLKASLENIFPFWEKKYAYRGGIIRTNRRGPHGRKLFSDLFSFGEKAPATFLVKEQGLNYEISLNELQHPGLFLDQRDSRQRVRQVAKARRIANLFSFTCSFSVVAASAEAEVVFSVDLAAGMLERGKNNFENNNLSKSGRGKFIKEDVLKWLSRQVRKKEGNPEDFKSWDLVICDPPVFASSGKGVSFSVEREWPLLARSIHSILSENGIALFANNHRAGSNKYYKSILEKEFSRVMELSPPFDFPRLAGLPDHLRIYWCET